MDEGTESIDGFDWYYKGILSKCKLINSNKNLRKTFLREGINPNTKVIIKQFPISDKNLKKLLKEVYFLACCKNNKYFVEIIDAFLSEDEKYLFLVLREEGDNLSNISKFCKNPFIETLDLYKQIIFRVVCGLKILHEKGLSHNDIKPGNIVISENGQAKICDMGSTDKFSKIIYGGTNGYLSPQALLSKKRTKEDDMWALGVVYLELFKRNIGIFYIHQIGDENQNKKEVEKSKLKLLLEKFYDIKIHGGDWNENINYNEIMNLIDNNDFDYQGFEYHLKESVFSDIKNILNEDKELIANLLDLNPSKRKTADEVINLTMFPKLFYTFDNSEIKYFDYDYNKYFNDFIDKKTFKKYLEEIKEKFIGLSLFE